MNAFVQQQVMNAIYDDDLTSCVSLLRRESWLLSDASVKFQVHLIEGTAAGLKDGAAFLKAFLDLGPAVLHCSVPPFSRVFVHAFTYAKAHVVPMLVRIWPLPDDLPHAAANGDFERVRRWFDASGKPNLGELANHFPRQR